MNPRKLFFAFAFGLLAGGLQAQTPAPARTAGPAVRFPELPQPSPLCTNIQHVGLSDITIVYSRPSARRHVVFGGIVPYGDVWRTGDNASTKITFSAPARFGSSDGPEIQPGTYALYSIPDEKEWTLIFYKDPGLWGKEGYDPKNDLYRINVTPVKLAEPVETLTIELNDIQDDSAALTLSWARTRISVKLAFDFMDDLLVKLKTSMDSPARKGADTYLRAATFYFDHTKDFAQELLWVNAGLSKNSSISYQLLYLKAKILAKMGDRDGAIAAATQSSDQAREAEGPSTPYYQMNQEVIKSLH
jgi:Protein of unknown function (DUF2911)